MTPEERSDKLLALVERVAAALERIAILTPPPAIGNNDRHPSVATPPMPMPAVASTPIWNCPKCNEPMLLRTAKASGKQFWGCRNFPKCDGARGEDGSAWTRRGPGGGAVGRRSRSTLPVDREEDGPGEGDF